MIINLRSILFGLSLRIMQSPRKKYHEKKSKLCKNKSISLLCNNCTGGVILHDLGLRFNTPTINIGIRNPDEFLFFVENIENLIETDFQELEFEKYHLPAGFLSYEGKTIDVVFTHYKDFNEGRRKWMERMKRINFENIYILYESPNVSKAFIEKFSMLPYRKALLSIKTDVEYDFYYGFNFYKKWKPGKILNYKSWFSVKRYLDDFDYISFFNK